MHPLIPYVFTAVYLFAMIQYVAFLHKKTEDTEPETRYYNYLENGDSKTFLGITSTEIHSEDLILIKEVHESSNIITHTYNLR